MKELARMREKALTGTFQKFERITERVELPRVKMCSCGKTNTHSEIVATKTHDAFWFMCECGSTNCIIDREKWKPGGSFLALLLLFLVACGHNDGEKFEKEKREAFTAEIVTVDVDIDREERTELDYDSVNSEIIESTEEDVTVTLTGRFTEKTTDLVRFNWAFVTHVVAEGEEPSCEDPSAEIVVKGADLKTVYEDLDEGVYEAASCVLNLNKGEYHDPIYVSFEI